ncbi:hypothetical protein BCF74_11768 [Knoellia remsis]|uniref:Ribonuclease VapC n=1 Tax=Knoellia remsis TaxID=407159 RepID=A0A2T0UGI2_9MICO|nr:TA system VapC family ribonuclease toxin [Knoellia remsis]PRY57063.1 hypothetical protein BCF74_11768 [Knoellia remsis]
MTESTPPTLLFDVNVLVALALTNHVHHRGAHRALASTNSWATTPVTEAGFFRLMTNPAVTGMPLTGRQAADTLAGMRALPTWRFLPDPSSLAAPVIDTTVLVGHQQVTDFHLVNLAAFHGAILGTFDAALVTALAPADRRHAVVLAS